MLKKLTQIKTMRFVKIETDPIYITSLIEEILYKDCIRIVNEYTMKLLLSNELSYSRTIDEISKQDFLFLEGKSSEAFPSEKQSELMK